MSVSDLFLFQEINDEGEDDWYEKVLDGEVSLPGLSLQYLIAYEKCLGLIIFLTMISLKLVLFLMRFFS